MTSFPTNELHQTISREFKSYPSTIYAIEEIEKTQNELLSKPSSEAAAWFPIPKTGEVNFQSKIDINKIKITQEYVAVLDKYLDTALKDFTGFSKPGCDGFVVALSGGLDSAVSTRLLQNYCDKRNKKLEIVIMGRGNHNLKPKYYSGTPAEWIDIQYAKNMCAELGLDFKYIDINNQYKMFTEGYATEWAKSSALPQIRALHLNSQATENDLISVGSTNGTEFILAAFSTGGPAGNIAPLIDLYKSEVYAVARDIGIPQYIIDRKPLISELNLSDYSLYGDSQGVDVTILDPILRRLWYHKQSPKEVADALGHSENWVNDIYEKRIVGETCRRGYKPLVINRAFGQEIIEPDLVINRYYFL